MDFFPGSKPRRLNGCSGSDTAMEEETYENVYYQSQLTRPGDPLTWTLTVRGLGEHVHFYVTCTADSPLRATIRVPNEFGKDDIRLMTSLVVQHYYHHGRVELRRVEAWIRRCGSELME
jgi:hypothetical protein